MVGDLLDSLGTPLLVVGLDLEIHCRNRAAERLLGVADGLALTDGKLSLRAAPLDQRFRSLCAEARDDAVKHARPVTRVMRVARTQARPDLVLLAHLRPTWVVGSHDPVVLVVPIDMRLNAEVHALLREINGLTRTESAVVQGLMSGGRVVEVARELDMSPETARAHVKRAFKKVGVHSQQQLIRHMAIQMFTLAQFCGAE